MRKKSSPMYFGLAHRQASVTPAAVGVTWKCAGAGGGEGGDAVAEDEASTEAKESSEEKESDDATRAESSKDGSDVVVAKFGERASIAPADEAPGRLRAGDVDVDVEPVVVGDQSTRASV